MCTKGVLDYESILKIPILGHLKSIREDTIAQFENTNIFRKLGSFSGSW